MSYTSSFNDFTKLSTYFEKQQWGPKENNPIPPPMNYPLIPVYNQNYGINTLSHGYNGVGYYTIETGYGQKNQCTTFNVASCPSNIPVAPFTKIGTSPSLAPSSSKEFYSPNKELHIFLKQGCPYCDEVKRVYLSKLKHVPDTNIVIHDINTPSEIQLFQKLGGTGVPFFYSSKTQNVFQGLPSSLEQLLNSLQLSASPSSVQNVPSSVDPIKDLLIQIIISNSCKYCHQLVNMLKQHNVIDKIKIWTSSDPDAQNIINKYSVRGFPFIISLKTNKHITGAPRSIDQLIAALS